MAVDDDIDIIPILIDGLNGRTCEVVALNDFDVRRLLGSAS